MILKQTTELLKNIYKYRKIPYPQLKRVVIGLGYTGVEVETLAFDPFLGLASTLPEIIRATSCSKIEFAGKLTELPIITLLEWANYPPSLKKIIGVATLNALSQQVLAIENPHVKLNLSLLKELNLNKNSNVLFIGLIKPLIQEITQTTKNITIIENDPLKSDLSSPFTLKRSIHELSLNDFVVDALICTGTALLNDTLESILESFKNRAKNIVVLGPTASMIPDILFDWGVDLVGGISIKNANETLKVIEQGGGTKLFQSFGEKYFLKKKDSE
ncbi:MAG: Rossmann-like domain-containing protein [Promethearchaeota archaeon]